MAPVKRAASTSFLKAGLEKHSLCPGSYCKALHNRDLSLALLFLSLFFIYLLRRGEGVVYTRAGRAGIGATGLSGGLTNSFLAASRWFLSDENVTLLSACLGPSRSRNPALSGWLFCHHFWEEHSVHTDTHTHRHTHSYKHSQSNPPFTHTF